MSRSAESYVLAYRRGRSNDSAIEKAAKTAERDPELQRRLESQAQFDDQIDRAIHAIAPPASLREKLHGNGEARVKGKPFAVTLLITILCSASVVIGLLVFFEIDRREKFGGSEAVAKIVGTAKNMSGTELTQVNNKTGQLGDWFYMRGFEDFALPQEFAETRALGSRVFKVDGHNIAQVGIQDNGGALLYLLRADDFGIDLPGDEDWRFRQYDDWAAAVRSRNGLCTVVALRGSKSDLKNFLKPLEKK
jgi:hypothetical protein